MEVQLVSIEDRQTKQLWGKSINLVKVVWDRRTCDSTWELEEDMRKSYPHLFSSKSQIFEVDNFVVGENVKSTSDFKIFGPSLIKKAQGQPTCIFQRNLLSFSHSTFYSVFVSTPKTTHSLLLCLKQKLNSKPHFPLSLQF